MTLTEAIKHCEDIADYDCFTDDQRKCSDEHRQLADWLRELKERREKAQLSGEDATFDCISRQDAIDAIHEDADWLAAQGSDWQVERMERDKSILMSLPSAESERDIPIKPIETHDKAWGIPLKQAVCPKCDYYLGHVAFLGDYKGKRITYCETCGQAIDWEGWDFDE